MHLRVTIASKPCKIFEHIDPKTGSRLVDIFADSMIVEEVRQLEKPSGGKPDNSLPELIHLPLGPDNALPVPPSVPDNTLPNVPANPDNALPTPPPVAGQPLPTPPPVAGQPLPTPPATPKK